MLFRSLLDSVSKQGHVPEVINNSGRNAITNAQVWPERKSYGSVVSRFEVLMFRFCEVASARFRFTYHKTAKTEKTERFIESRNCKDKLPSS